MIQLIFHISIIKHYSFAELDAFSLNGVQTQSKKKTIFKLSHEHLATPDRYRVAPRHDGTRVASQSFTRRRSPSAFTCCRSSGHGVPVLLEQVGLNGYCVADYDS